MAPPGGAFLLPLAYAWDTHDQYVLPKLLLARAFVIGLFILFIVRTIITETWAIRRSPLDLPLLASIASALLSTVFAFNQNVAVFGTYSRYDGLLTILTYALLFWLWSKLWLVRPCAQALVRVLLASGYLVAACAVVQSVTASVAQGALARCLPARRSGADRRGIVEQARDRDQPSYVVLDTAL